MKKIGFFSCLPAYIRGKIKTIVFFLLSAVILCFVLFLYRQQPEAVAYAAVISLIIGLVMVFTDYCRFVEKHRRLTEAAKNAETACGNLPKTDKLIEKDYQNIVKLLDRSRNDILDKTESQKKFMQDYYAMWVHQIKVPISAMRLLMSNEEKNSPLSIELFKIEQYVEMALSYVRLNSDSTDYLIKEYDIDDIVKQAVRKYAPLFIAKKIRLDIADMNMKVLTDEKWILFVIEQILSNSLKYTKKGYIKIYTEKPKTLVIEDSGIGIAPEDIKRIGEKGFTGYNGRIEKKSTGLGLYLCTEILHNLSHKMTVESELSKGTRVYIDFEMKDMIFE
ncbi:MAG: sensor histidine kinase [Anaerovoracaceae bacterium]